MLRSCQNESGGFGGGPSQLSHVAPTYAAVNTIAILGIQEGYDMIDRLVSFSPSEQISLW